MVETNSSDQTQKLGGGVFQCHLNLRINENMLITQTFQWYFGQEELIIIWPENMH